MAVFQVNASSRRKFITLHINGQPVRLQLDTASDITNISEKLWHTLGQHPVQEAKQIAISACGGHVPLTDQLHCCVSLRGKTSHGSCFVTTSELNLLGLDWFYRLGLADTPIDTICNHQLMDSFLAGIQGVALYQDEVLIVGVSPEEPRKRTEKVLQRIEDTGFRLRPEKRNFFLQYVKFLRFIFKVDGQHPDPENIQAIQRMPAHTDSIYGRQFPMLTDQKPLLPIFESKTGIPAHSANILQRWALTPLGYDFKLQCRQTEVFGQEDALSRLNGNYPTSDE
ncbi:uncharacterized protein DEA37_0013338 [Paragonimus westermani]|uniref:Peptidase A2 domain-containing protein n=1 Tax=Paragonimus westermani TaxID=34504 RepID=A0A5J4P132_9TREM|nr:uncharacterized protein DEA37_0013338 [Paragonimus westermani]